MCRLNTKIWSLRRDSFIAQRSSSLNIFAKICILTFYSTRRSILGSDGMMQSVCALIALWLLLKWVWAKKMKIKSFRQTRLGRTDERTKIGISWAPVGAKNLSILVLMEMPLHWLIYQHGHSFRSHGYLEYKLWAHMISVLRLVQKKYSLEI